MKFMLVAICIFFSTAAIGGFSMVQVANNNTGPGGYLLDDSAGFLTNGAGGKLFAR